MLDTEHAALIRAHAASLAKAVQDAVDAGLICEVVMGLCKPAPQCVSVRVDPCSEFTILLSMFRSL